MDALPVIDSCDGCGACCSLMMMPPFEDEDDAMYVPPELEAELDEVWQASLSDPTLSRIGKPCFWFNVETRKCKHYEFRPAICRRFEIGNPICREDRERIGLS